MKSFFLNFLFLTTGLLLAVAASEGLARLFYSAPWHQKLISDQEDSFRARYTKNKLGLRDHDYPKIKGENTTRILMMGDSFTFGQGVPRMEDTFPEIIENQLNPLNLRSILLK